MLLCLLAQRAPSPRIANYGAPAAVLYTPSSRRATSLLAPPSVSRRTSPICPQNAPPSHVQACPSWGSQLQFRVLRAALLVGDQFVSPYTITLLLFTFFCSRLHRKRSRCFFFFFCFLPGRISYSRPSLAVLSRGVPDPRSTFRHEPATPREIDTPQQRDLVP